MKKIRVIIRNDQKTVKIPTGIRMIVRRSCIAVLNMEKFTEAADINVLFVDNAQMQELNKKHRNIDKPTDVLSFPLGKDGKYDINPEDGACMLGDIVISMEKAYEQASTYGHSLQREVAFLTTHAALHLLGYDHEVGGIEKVRMREKEEQIMVQLGLPGTSSYVMEDDVR